LLLISDSIGDNAIVMESLVSLLNPFKWTFVFINYLTPALVDCLEAPFPFFIGTSRKIWEELLAIRELPEDIIIYDIDKHIFLRNKDDLPPLAQPFGRKLVRQLMEQIDDIPRYFEKSKKAKFNISQEKLEEVYWGYAQLKIRQMFFNFFLLVLNNYLGFFKVYDEDCDLSPGKQDKKCN